MIKNKIIKTSSLAAIVILLFLLPTILSGNQYYLSVLTLLIINILLVSSLRSVTLIDQISLGQIGFALIGAYSSALLMMKAHLPFWPAMVISGLIAATVAFVLGYPFLKVKGIYFSILTLLTAETIRLVAFYWTDFTGGTQGLIGIPSPEPMTLPFLGIVKFNTINNYYYIVLFVVLLCLLITYLIERSHINFKWRAIKDADELANSVGINVMWYKIVNFTIASFFAGISGSLFAHFQHNLSVDINSRFAVTTSIYLLVYMVVGGLKSFSGPIIGTAILVFLAEISRPMQAYQPIIIGIIAILVVLFMPYGLTGIPSQVREWIRVRRNSKIFTQIIKKVKRE